ncbi:MAG: hypothetical protein K6E84_00530 [Lachnospiraceae bacterium]|nr:hypothetical protein [Lachnospiraceae bacterium]
MNWKDEIRKTIYRQLPQEGETVYEQASDPKKLNTKNEPSIWEKTAMAVHEELMQDEEEEIRTGFRAEMMQNELFNTDSSGNGSDIEDSVGAAGTSDRPDDESFKFEEETKGKEKEVSQGDLSQEVRQWLFKENLRLEGLRSELAKASKMMQQQAAKIKEDSEQLEKDKKLFAKEKEEFTGEMKDWTTRIRHSQEKLNNDQMLFDKKYKVLEMGFAKLNEDRKQLESQKRAFEYKKKFMADAQQFDAFEEGAAVVAASGDYIFFKGLTHPVAIKKRYKELIKIYHPDNTDGDKYILQLINKEYDRIRKN